MIMVNKDYQISSLTIDTSVVKFSWFKIRSVVLRKVANRQTDRQTNAGHYITFLEDAVNTARFQRQLTARIMDVYYISGVDAT